MKINFVSAWKIIIIIITISMQFLFSNLHFYDFFFSFVLGENSFFFHVHIPLAPRCVRDDNFPRLSAGWGRSSSNQASMVSLLIMHGDVARFSLSSSICVKDRWKFFFSFYFSPSTRRKEKRVFHFLHVDALLARHIPSLRMTHYQHSLLVFHPSSYAIIFFCFSALLTQRFSSRFFFRFV